MKWAVMLAAGAVWLFCACTDLLIAESALSGTAVSAASADFDEDGVADLAIGSSVHSFRMVTFFRGAAAAPFRVSTSWFQVSSRELVLGDKPDLLLSGDWNADGHFDLLAIRKDGGAATLLLGNGKGGVASVSEFPVAGQITAAARGDINRPDGLEDLVFGASHGGASSVYVYQSPIGAIYAKPEEYAVPSPVRAIVIANLDGDAWADIAIATAGELRIIHGRAILSESERTTAPTIESVPLRFGASSMVAGDFAPTPGMELAFLSGRSDLRLLYKGSDGNWTWSVFRVPPASALQRVRRTGCPQDDLLITGLDGHSYVWNVSRPDKIQNVGTGRMFPMRLNGDAPDDLVQISASGKVDVILSQPSAGFTVDSNADDPDNNVGDGICMTAGGVCTLRAAIQEANATPGVDGIGFAVPVPPTTVPVISPTTPLPVVTEAVTIDGTTQPAGLVHLRGTAVPDDAGLQITSGSSTIRGMVITEFAFGIRLDTGGFNFIEGNIIGLDPTGTIAMGNTYNGIRVDSTNNTIGGTTPAQRNIISANGGFSNFDQDNLFIDFGATATLIYGNYIGTDISGSVGLTSSRDGVGIASIDNAIGSIWAGSGNVISGNGTGIAIGIGAGNNIDGNLIGTDPSGTFAVPNEIGVLLGGSFAIIGGALDYGRNTISGNGVGVYAADGLFETVAGSIVRGNYIGLNSAGTAALGNVEAGVQLRSSGVMIGYTSPGDGNVISGNGAGIRIGDNYFPWSSNNNSIIRNYIGTDPTGLVDIGNAADGIVIDSGATENVIGDADPNNGNLISGNGGAGIRLNDAIRSRILNNVIGLDATGTQMLGNATGIEDFGSTDSVIGLPGSGNVICSLGIGVNLHAPAINAAIQGNLIGTDSSGTTVIGNVEGIKDEGASFTVIGGPVAGAGNVVSGSLFMAIEGGYLVQGNLIGTDVTGTVALGNGQIGVYGAQHVGGDQPGEGNVISGNIQGGVSVLTDGAQVKGNLIGTDITGTVALGNGGSGIDVFASNVEIGGLNPGAANRIANNAAGVWILGGTGNSIHGNSIHSNSELGIDLSTQGVTANDVGDSDVGPNQLQNFPVLTSANISGGNTVIEGTLNSTPSAQYTIEFFSNLSCDPSQHGEGETFIGLTSLATDSSGDARFSIPFAGLTPGSYVTATATDSGNNTSEFSQCIQITSCQPISISPSSLPNGQVGAAYNQILSASGGTPPYGYSLSAGLLPPGINVNRGTGEMAGTPLAPGLYGFVIAATDSNNCTGTQLYAVTITCGSVTVLPATLPDGVVGSPYNATISANGGNGPYIFDVAAGSLPPGLSLDSGTGGITGTPSSAGAFSFTITATDASGCTGLASHSVTIASSCLFCDNFEDGTLNPSWTYEKPSWTEPPGGNLIGIPPRKKAIAIATPAFGGCGNCTVESTISSAGGTGNRISLLGWYLDKHNNVELMMKEENDKWILKERINGSIVAKAGGAAVINPGQFYDVVVGFDGTQFSVSVNGTTLITLPAHGPHNGTIGFQVKATTGSFGRIAVN